MTPRAAIAALVLAGCAHPPPPPTAWDWHATASDAEIAGFRDARVLLDGRDAPRPGEPVSAGDCALFGLCLLDGGERREWFLRVTALADEVQLEPGRYPATILQLFAASRPLASDLGSRNYVRLRQPIRAERLRIEVFDGALRLLADEQVDVAGFLFHGVLRGCCRPSTFFEPTTSLSAAEEARAALADVMRIVRETDSLLAMLREVAQLPPLWTLLRGVRVKHDAALERAAPATGQDGGLAFAFPLRVLINGSPALLCTVTATEPAPPLRVCGGFTRLVACDPDDADRRVVMTLLAARCGRPANADPR